jgi:UDP-N-acetylglucosamine 1-carboxyvinyltransferase
MSRFRIQGGKKLRGRLRAAGMKNAATPILAATLLTDGTCVLKNVPRIRDVERMLDILRSLGVRVEWAGDHELSIEPKGADPAKLDRKAMRSMRSSVLFLGPMLARFREVELPEPGGCIIGNRPLDTHLVALQALGASCERGKEGYLLRAEKLVGRTVVLPEFSVTATENLMMAAALSDGRTVIKLAAAEPHVQDLGDFLNAMGARIQGHGTHTVTIDGVSELHGAEHEIIPDQIEAGTFMVAAALTRGDLTIEHVRPDHLDVVTQRLEAIGANVEIGSDSVRVTAPGALKAFKFQSMPYPGLPTDLMAPFGVLATQCAGTSMIHEPMYEGRFGFVNELVKMGANAVVCDPHRVLISGPTPLYGQDIKSLDLRAGATLLLAGILADGETVLHEAEIIDRGYERIEERFAEVGAVISRESEP